MTLAYNRLLFAALFTFTLLFCSCQEKRSIPSFSGPTMGTRYTIKIREPLIKERAEALRSRVTKKLERIDRLMSTYKEDSQISQFNRFNDTEWFGINAETAAVLRLALDVSALTRGAFDVTIAPIVNAWGFGPTKTLGRLPKDETIATLLSRVGYDKLEMAERKNKLRKKLPDLYVDLSGIAKGYAVDEISRLLKAEGIRDFMVEIGGELRVSGLNLKGEAWQIAIENPETNNRTPLLTIPLDNTAMATSGDYRNFFAKEDKRYSHIIDPRTGRPITHSLASVTVLEKSCARADALATGLFVLGPEAGYKLATTNKLAALFVTRSEKGLVQKATPTFEKITKKQ